VLCHGTDTTVLIADGRDYEYGVAFQADVVQCQRCGLAYQQPMPTLADLPRYYPPHYANYAAPAHPLTRSLVRLAEALEVRDSRRLMGRQGRVLDVGCADGHYLALLRRHAQWALEGSDLHAAAARGAIEQGFPVHLGQLEDVALPANRFTLLRMNHLLEHVINPVTTLQTAYEILQPGGHLLIETPNIGCWDFALFKRYWGALHLPRHTYFFTPETVQRLLHQAGFQVIQLHSTLMTTGWALGVQNFLERRGTRRLVGGRATYYPWLLIAFVPVVVAQALFGRSTMMRVVARKPEVSHARA